MSAPKWLDPGPRLSAAAAPRNKAVSGPPAACTKSPKTILLVDEDKTERGRIRTVLEDHGYRVLEASEYWEALHLQEQHPNQINMLLTAIALPGNNGYELAADMVRVDPALRVLFASGVTGAEVSRFYNMPVAGPHLLNKPVEPAELVARVKRVFRTRRPHFHVQRAS